ncbi:hypothetical protein ACFQE8_18840 [Salinirubellus sp. GCM10025818]|uniref:hypothetical protein n=1 Tax=Salinirubellus TaxID=2162630 RepID=UPI0030D4095B
MTDAPSTLSRRSLLASGVTGCALLAGCAGAGSSDCSFGFELAMTPATDEEFLEETLTDPSRDRPDAWREIVSAAVERDESRYTTVHAAPVRDGDRVEYEGGYYRIARGTADRVEVEAHVLSAEYDRERDPPSGATVVPFEDLPEPDRVALRSLLPNDERRLAEAEAFTISGRPVVYPDASESESVLLSGGSTWVRYDDGAVEVRVEGTERVERVTYRYTAEELADDREAYLAHVREAFVVDLGEVPESEREVFSRAIDAGEDGIQLCEPEGAERAVVDRLESIPESETPHYHTWFLDYEGEVYRTELVEFAV